MALLEMGTKGRQIGKGTLSLPKAVEVMIMKDEGLEFLTGQVAELILGSKRIVVFTGAGVSTESGIPDFRSPDGIWTQYDPEDFTYQKFLSSKESRRKIWQMIRESGIAEPFQPNPAHYAIVELERLGKLECVITQNVDQLHQKAGNSEQKVIQLHGNMEWARCLRCGHRYLVRDLLNRMSEGADVPECDDCQGILKPEGVFFGEPMPFQETMEAERYSKTCDLFIVIGSSLVVYPAASMPIYALKSGAKLVIINESPTDLDRYAHVCIPEKASRVMLRVVDKLKYGVKV